MNTTGSKSIKLSQETYDKLDQLRGKGQTFSQAVDMLCEVAGVVLKLTGDINKSLADISLRQGQPAKQE